MECCKTGFFVRVWIILLLVAFAGLMSGLTLGLMSLSLVDLEVLAKSGTPTDRRYAEKILPVVRRQHLLLCTLLLCNAAATEALPIFLDGLVTPWGAILLSVTLILLFGEIIPQAVCSRYGLAIGAAVAPVVRVLICICFPIALPISKLLDFLLGQGHDEALLRRAELKTLVDLHGNEAGKGGELTRHETTIIAGALELTGKTAWDVMTPIAETFAININAKLDRDLLKLILDKGHSRIPVYYEQPQNIIGLMLVKNLLAIHPGDDVLVKNVTIRRIPRVPDMMPLYDILNEFQKGHSHMAAVLKERGQTEHSTINSRNEEKDVKVDILGEGKSVKKKRSSKKLKVSREDASKLQKATSKSRKWAKDFQVEVLKFSDNLLPKLAEEGEAIGIITLDDVIGELLQEEIFDETDHRHENT